MNAIQAFVPSKVVKTFASFLEFYYTARRNIIMEDSLERLNVALHKFHNARQVFSGTVWAAGPSGFSLPRQHAMVHYHDHIKNFGAPNGLCSSITESKHITAVKRPWCRSNKHTALSQMLKSNERLDKLAAARADFTAHDMLADSCLIEAIKNALSGMDHNSDDPMDDSVTDSDETNSDVSSEIWPFDANHTNIRDRPGMHGVETDDTDAHILDPDNDYPYTRHPSPTLPDDNEDDCGPVESGPLMNEVRLVSKKGKNNWPKYCKNTNIVHSTHTGIPLIAYCTRSKDWPTRPPRSHSPLPLLSTRSHISHWT